MFPEEVSHSLPNKQALLRGYSQNPYVFRRLNFTGVNPPPSFLIPVLRSLNVAGRWRVQMKLRSPCIPLMPDGTRAVGSFSYHFVTDALRPGFFDVASQASSSVSNALSALTGRILCRSRCPCLPSRCLQDGYIHAALPCFLSVPQ